MRVRQAADKSGVAHCVGATHVQSVCKTLVSDSVR